MAGHNHLVMGPWRHSQVNYDGYNLGPLKWDGDTALQFRRDVLKPFFDQYLKTGAPRAETPPVFIYNTGENHWDRLTEWPPACEAGCAGRLKPLYLAADRSDLTSRRSRERYRRLRFRSRQACALRSASVGLPTDNWKQWLVSDQRSVEDRPDVLAYETPVLTAPVRVAVRPSRTCSRPPPGRIRDWVVKLIDVFPDEVPSQPEMGGYQLALSMDIFRGRYRESFEHPPPSRPASRSATASRCPP